MAALLKFQICRLTTIVGVITWHYAIGTNVKLIGLGHLANDFCRSCGDEEKDETILHLLCTWHVLGQRRHLGAYIMQQLDELSS